MNQQFIFNRTGLPRF